MCVCHSFNSEVSTPKKQHLMIFMRVLLTTIIGQCPVKALNTKLAIGCLYKAVMRFTTSLKAPKWLMIFIAHNDIHGSLEEGYSPGRIRERLRAQIHFSHTSYSLQIPALTRTLSPLNPKFSSLQATFSPHMPLTHLISISVQALTPKLHPCPLLALISSLVTLTTPTH